MTYTSSWELYRARSLYIDDGQAISKYKKKKNEKKNWWGWKKSGFNKTQNIERVQPPDVAQPLTFLYGGGREVFIFFLLDQKK